MFTILFLLLIFSFLFFCCFFLFYVSFFFFIFPVNFSVHFSVLLFSFYFVDSFSLFIILLISLCVFSSFHTVLISVSVTLLRAEVCNLVSPCYGNIFKIAVPGLSELNDRQIPLNQNVVLSLYSVFGVITSLQRINYLGWDHELKMNACLKGAKDAILI